MARNHNTIIIEYLKVPFGTFFFSKIRFYGTVVKLYETA